MKILLLANKTIGIFEVLYAIKFIDSFAGVLCDLQKDSSFRNNPNRS